MSSALSSQRSWIARIAVLALVASLMAFGAAPAGAAIDTSDSCPTSIPDAGFTDLAGVPAAAVDAINCIADYGISTGTTATTFDPFAVVQRWQMALFLTRQAEIHGVTLPAGADQGFTDLGGVPASAVTAINQTAELGISTGTSATTFDPFGDVERWQMALFLTRLIDAAGITLPAGADQGFTDLAGVPAAAVTAINQLAELDVADGTTATTFDPFADVERWAMALFLARTLAADGITPPPVVGEFSVSPAGQQLLEFDPSSGSSNPSMFVTFSGLDDDEEYDVAFFPINWGGGYEDSVRMEGGDWVFRDQDTPFDGIADDPGGTYNGYAMIRSINGVGVDAQSEYDVSPENGELDIRIDNDTSQWSDGGYLVVWESDGDDDLELDDSDMSTEAFAVAGPIVWHGPEAVLGEETGDFTIVFADQDAGLIVPDDEFVMFYDSGDNYSYDCDEYDISFGNFDSWVNSGDYLEAHCDDTKTYNPGGASDFDLYEDYPATPVITGAEAGDFDSNDDDTADNDVLVEWSHNPAMANMAEDTNGDAGYCITRWDADTDASVTTDCFDWSAGTAEADAVITDLEYTIEDVPAGDWYFTVYAMSATNDSGDYSDPSADVTTDVASGAPISESTTTNDADLSGTVTSGDVLTVTFDQDMDLGVAGDSITLQDGDGTTCSLTHAGNATFAYATDTLTVTLIGAPSCTAAGSTGGLQYPVDVTDSSGVVDLDQGIEWNITDSTDVTFD